MIDRFLNLATLLSGVVLALVLVTSDEPPSFWLLLAAAQITFGITWTINNAEDKR